MDDTRSQNLSMLTDTFLEPLFIASGLSALDKALEHLIDIAKTSDGRLVLGTQRLLVSVLELCKSPFVLSAQDLLLSIKLIRNLCAGEIRNQNLFIEQNGVEILSTIISSMGLTSGSDNGMLRMLLQTLGNVSLAGEQHCLVIWHKFFPQQFLDIAGVRSRESCDTLCMILYTCTEGSSDRSAELVSALGLDIVTEIARTISVVGFQENWVKYLLSRICLEEYNFLSVFSKLSPVVEPQRTDENALQTNHFGADQAFLLNVLAEVLNSHVGDIVICNNFPLCIFRILKDAVGLVDFSSRGTLPLPTGSVDIDAMGYTLSILRDIIACDGPKFSKPDEKMDVVDMLVSAGLVKFLILLLRDLEPPAIIRKAVNCGEAIYEKASQFSKYCPYKGFRRDVVAIIGNCSYRKKHVQDEIREQDGILLLLQQCVTDEDNPFLREWGIWSMRNILEGNVENQQLVADLEIQRSVNTSEIANLGLQVEVDPTTRRPKLVNASKV